MSKLINCLINGDNSYVPVWFMRQAGRYLPEFRKIRSKNTDFLKLCLNSEMASEITLQPLKRYNLDAAIIFSDILVVPHALGQNVIFEKSKTPLVENFDLDKLLSTKMADFISVLKPVYDAIKITRKTLSKEKSLIAFVAAPWTLLIYLLNLKKGDDLQLQAVKENKIKIKLILDKLDEFLKQHILHQKEAGADVIQIFDSWAGLIHQIDLTDYCMKPNQSLVSYCNKNNIPTICFPKGIGQNYKKFVEIVRPDGINIDSSISPNWAIKNLQNLCIQGGMDPTLLLMNNEKQILNKVDEYLETFKKSSYIFNLGHGILPQTDPEIIKKIVERIKQ